MIFQNRKHAADLLGLKLAQFRDENPLILALPRGGVPIAAEIAQRLEIPWNVLIVRKIGAPFQSELAVGAICENDEPYLNEDSLAYTGLKPRDLVPVIKAEKIEIHRQTRKFRDGKEIERLKGRTVILIDDGLATGNTVRAALKFLRKKDVNKIIVAVPIAATNSAEQIRREADLVVSVEEREDLLAIGTWYEDFSPVSDDEVLAYLHPAPSQISSHRQEITIMDQDFRLNGNLTIVPQMKALIIFAYGGGSSRLSPRNQLVAQELNHAGYGTFLFDMLTFEESEDRHKLFDTPLLSRRLLLATRQLKRKSDLENLPFGFFGAGTGAGAALRVAAELTEEGDKPFAIVIRGGRPDLAKEVLEQVESPTLFIVGEKDSAVIQLNEQATALMSQAQLSVVRNATHLFEEEGALETVAKEAIEWFEKHSWAQRKLKSSHGSRRKGQRVQPRTH